MTSPMLFSNTEGKYWRIMSAPFQFNITIANFFILSVVRCPRSVVCCLWSALHRTDNATP